MYYAVPVHALYISHTGMGEPLGQSQVLPYLRGLARYHGWTFDLVAFEPADVSDEQAKALAESLSHEGITYSWSRRSASHSLTTKGLEAANAFARLALRALRQRPQIIHARSYLPAAVGLALTAATPGANLIFDCRGLLADEYVDAGHWTPQSTKYRLVKRMERTLFARAQGVVTLTERLRRWLIESAGLLPESTPVEVIPCCVDTQRFRADMTARRRIRTAIGAGDRFVVAYSGSLGSWYREPDMARLFAAIRRRRPSMLLVLTRSSPKALIAHLAGLGIGPEDIRVQAVNPADMPGYLSAADAGLSLIDSCFSKMASSPTKIAEYLSVGLPVAMNTDIGDGADLANATDAVVDVGTLTSDDCERAAVELLGLASTPEVASRAHRLAEERFAVETVGVVRYARLYSRLASTAPRTTG